MRATPQSQTGVCPVQNNVTPVRHDVGMVQAQLQLIPEKRSWRLDADTRRVGRAGLAQARAALAAADSPPDITAARAAPITERQSDFAPAA